MLGIGCRKRRLTKLVSTLQAEVQKRQQAEQRRQALEQALAVPLASGRVTLRNGRIGISGSVRFTLNFDLSQPEGRQLLSRLAAPLAAYLGSRDELLMVSGFTDDKQVSERNPRFADNLELSAQRALTMTRALVEAGLPSASVFADIAPGYLRGFVAQVEALLWLEEAGVGPAPVPGKVVRGISLSKRKTGNGC